MPWYEDDVNSLYWMSSPVDDSRVVLNEIEGEEGSDYINASYIQVSTCTYSLQTN